MTEDELKTEVFNAALKLVDSPSLLESWEDQREAAQVCRQFYEDIRTELLDSFPWTFATKEVLLEELDLEHSNWRFVYKYPEGFLKISRLHLRNSEREEKYAVELMDFQGSEVQVVLSDCSEVYLRGIRDIRHGFDRIFKRLLEFTLAESIAEPLGAPKGTLDRISLKRLELSQKNMARDASQVKVEDPDPDWFSQRYV